MYKASNYIKLQNKITFPYNSYSINIKLYNRLKLIFLSFLIRIK